MFILHCALALISLCKHPVKLLFAYSDTTATCREDDCCFICLQRRTTPHHPTPPSSCCLPPSLAQIKIMALFAGVPHSTFTQGKCLNMSTRFCPTAHEITKKGDRGPSGPPGLPEGGWGSLSGMEGDSRVGKGRENNPCNYPGKLNMI